MISREKNLEILKNAIEARRNKINGAEENDQVIRDCIASFHEREMFILRVEAYKEIGYPLVLSESANEEYKEGKDQKGNEDFKEGKDQKGNKDFKGRSCASASSSKPYVPPRSGAQKSGGGSSSATMAFFTGEGY